MNDYNNLKLENQLCFPLYVCSKEIIRKYKPFLDEIDLTYTQYITMMVLWEREKINVKELGEYLYLDSGTLSPLLKKLESKQYIKRIKNSSDERNLDIMITENGKELREKAQNIPSKISECVDLSKEDALQLYNLLHKVLNNFNEEK